MNSSVVSQMSRALCDTWNPYLRIAPVLMLDGTWPSIGTLDLFTFPMRLRTELEKEHALAMRQSAAYLAEWIAPVWRQLEAEVSVGRSEEEGVVVRARGGRFIPEGEVVELALENKLKYALQELPCPFPVMGKYERIISFDSNILSLFGIGTVSGLSPFVSGAWQQRSLADHKECLQVIGRELARQSAEHYAMAFPDEPFGQVAELYLRNLIFPPLLLNEALPALQAVNGVLSFFEEYKVGKEARLQLARNFSQSPDEAISSAGIVLYLALAERMPPPEVIAAAKAKGTFTGFLRLTMQHARERLGRKKDWISSGIITPEDEMRFRIEEAVGTVPWLYLSLARLKEGVEDAKLRALLDAMLVFDLDEAKKLCDEMVEEQPSDVELRLQRIRLTIVSGDLDKADDMFRSLLSESGSDESPRFYHLWGQCALAKEENDRAHSYFRAGLALPDIEPLLKSELANNLAWTYLLRGEGQESLRKLDLSLETAVCPVTALLNRAHILWATGNLPELVQVRKRLFDLAPCDRRVFSSLTAVKGETAVT